MSTNFISRIPKFTRVLVVSPAFYPDITHVENLEASRNKFSGWNVRYLGLGESFKSYVDAKIITVQQFLDLNKDMFEWAIIMDSADTIFAKPFNEADIIQILESFEKDIICGGEVELHYLKQLEGLYTSQMYLKYLNSGVVAVKNTAVSTLFNYLMYLYRRFPNYTDLEENRDAAGNSISVSPQIYYQLAYFSKKLGKSMAIDDTGQLSVSTKYINRSNFHDDTENNLLLFESVNTEIITAPYILHLQKGDISRVKDFKARLNIV